MIDVSVLMKELMSKMCFDATVPDSAEALLAYFRGRKSVRHPAQAGLDKTIVFRIPSEERREVADDALRNVLIASPSYPRHGFGEEIDWYTNQSPSDDLEWIIQLHRQYSWPCLAKAYLETGDEKYAEAWTRQLTSWLDNCAESTEQQPAWGSLEAGIRGHCWTHLFYHFLGSPHFAPSLLVRFLKTMHEHADYLFRGKFTTGNHGLMEAEGLAFIAMTFPEFRKSTDWLEQAVEHLNHETGVQVFPDGMDYEMNFSYHFGVAIWFLRTLELCRMNGMNDVFPAGYEETIKRMCEIPLRFMHPDGTQSMFGDDDRMDVRERIRLLHGKFPDNRTLAFSVSNGAEGSAPETFNSLPYAGLYSMRSGWEPDALHMILKCGQDGGWHCQPDNGTFELFAFGRYLMPDSGCYIYHGDVESRKWFRRTAVHQTMTLNNEDIAYAPRLVSLQRSEQRDILVVENSSYPDLTHRRAVMFLENAVFVIFDFALGKAEGDVDFHFQLCPCEPSFPPGELCIDTSFPRGGNVLIKHLPVCPEGRLHHEQGLVSFEYAKKEARPAWAIRFEKRSDHDVVSLVTVIAPYRDRAVPSLEMPAVDTRGITPGAMEMALRVDGRDLVASWHEGES